MSTNQPPPGPRIAVIGAGPAGLTFASVLHHLLVTNPGFGFNPEITIYERDNARATRDQGGTLDMHYETGQRALKLAGLWEEFQKLARYEGQATKILDKAGRVWLNHDGQGPPNWFAYDDESNPVEVPPRGHGGPPGGPGGPRGAGGEEGMSDAMRRPEVDRGLLNGLLIDSLPGRMIQWGKSVSTVRALNNGKTALTFSDGTTEEFDLVVGGDGAWSKARKLLTQVTPFYSGVLMVELHLTCVDSRIPHIGEWVGQGSVMACAENKGIFAQRNAGERVRVYFTLRAPETWPKDSGIDWTSVSTARPGIKQAFAGWFKEGLDLIELADEPANSPGVVVRPLYMLPPDNFKWEHKAGITLIGDSAHLMTPFAGEGANMAMADGMELAEAIFDAIKNTSNGFGSAMLDQAVKGYEEKLFPRAEEVMKDTFLSMNAFLNPKAPATGLQFMRESIPGAA